MPKQIFLTKEKFTYFIILLKKIMASFSIEAQIRAKDENCKHLRKEGLLPAVVYGRNQEAISLNLNGSEFLKLFRKTGESNIINLKVGKKEIEVLVHDYQKEPVSGEFIHIDFFALTRGEKLTTKVHLNFIWESAAVKEGAILEELQKELEISVLPKDLVDHIDIDLSVLVNAEDNIKVSDLVLPETITMLSPANEVIVLAGKPKVKTEDTEADAAEAAQGAEASEASTEA